MPGPRLTALTPPDGDYPVVGGGAGANPVTIPRYVITSIIWVDGCLATDYRVYFRRRFFKHNAGPT